VTPGTIRLQAGGAIGIHVLAAYDNLRLILSRLQTAVLHGLLCLWSLNCWLRYSGFSVRIVIVMMGTDNKAKQGASPVAIIGVSIMVAVSIAMAVAIIGVPIMVAVPIVITVAIIGVPIMVAVPIVITVAIIGVSIVVAVSIVMPVAIMVTVPIVMSVTVS